MEHERLEDEDKVERESDGLESAEGVYGDTDLTPNADDQKDAHHAESDEHV